MPNKSVDLNALSFDELPESLRNRALRCEGGPWNGEERSLRDGDWQPTRGLHIDVQLGGVGFGPDVYRERVRHWKGYYRLGVVDPGCVILIWDGKPPPSY